MTEPKDKRCHHCGCGGRIDFLGNDGNEYCSPDCRKAEREKLHGPTPVSAAHDPVELLALCRAASSFAPMKPSAQRALHDALTLLAFHFGGHSTFYQDNRRNASQVAATLTAWVEERNKRTQLAPPPTDQS